MLCIEKHRYLCGGTQIEMNPFLVHCVGSDMHGSPLIAMYVVFFSFYFANEFSIRLMGAWNRRQFAEVVRAAYISQLKAYKVIFIGGQALETKG